MTLAEAVVAMGLMAAMAALTLGLLTTANSFYRSGTQRSDATRLGAILFTKLDDDFFHMGARKRVVTETTCVHRTALDEEGVFQKDTQGYPAWQAWVEYAFEDSRLTRRRTQASPDETNLLLPATQWGPARTLVNDVGSGSWTESGDRDVTLSLVIDTKQGKLELNFLFTAGQGDAL
jgi:hypothetical protein